MTSNNVGNNLTGREALQDEGGHRTKEVRSCNVHEPPRESAHKAMVKQLDRHDSLIATWFK